MADEQDQNQDQEPGENLKKALEAERAARKAAEATAKQAQSDLDAKIQELETATSASASLTEQIESLTSENDDLTKKVSDEQLNRIRVETAVAKGLSLKLAPRLQGATAEEIEADADQLADITKSTTKPPLSAEQIKDLQPGGAPDSGVDLDPAKAAARVRELRS